MANVLVLGASGVIGGEIARHLLRDGHKVRGLARRQLRDMHGIEWQLGDAGRMSPAAWYAALEGIEVVVNAAGALQDGPRDSLRAVHVDLVRDLLAAIASAPIRVVQISAVGVSRDAPTAFMRTKAEGDALLAASGVDHVILRPGLVLAPQAYGGTALLRAAAALPGVLPDMLPQARIQTVHVADVATAAGRAVRGEVARGRIVDLVETDAHDLHTVLGKVRHWLGFPAARRVPVSGFATRLAGRLADLAGRLRWPSPLRTTALRTLEEGVTGTPEPDFPCRSLDQTLADLPATAQERRFARSWFLLPVAIVTLSAFWTISGLVALAHPDAARAALPGAPGWLATATVLGGAIADIALGLAVLWRPVARMACLGMAALSAAYMAGAVLFAPDLWADPLGPMVKVAPGLMLALLTASLLEER